MAFAPPGGDAMKAISASIVLVFVLGSCDRRSPCAVELLSVPSPDGQWRASIWEAKACGLSLNRDGSGVDLGEAQTGRKILVFAVTYPEAVAVKWDSTNRLQVNSGCTRSRAGEVLSSVTVRRPKVNRVDVAFQAPDTGHSEAHQR